MKRTSYLAPALSIAALGLLTACGSDLGDPQEILDAVSATEAAQLEAMAAGDARGATRFYATDAVVHMADGTTLDGFDAITASFDELMTDPNVAITSEQGPGWASASGDLAVTTSDMKITTTDEASGEPVTQSIRGQSVWGKTTTGNWKVVSEFLIAAGDEAEAAPAAEAAE